MPRTDNPDYVIDPDRGRSTTGAKTAVAMDVDTHATRVGDRAGLRDLDSMTEAMPGLTRAGKDRERAFPRQTTADLGDPRMRRQLPTAGQSRVPLSSRQRNARSKTRLSTQLQTPTVQLKAQKDLVTRHAQWQRLNDQLSANTGDVQAVEDKDQEQVRRVDRSIQAYERRNDRGHVVYSNVRMPSYINKSNVDGFVANNFEPGRTVTFDRFTAATHQMHETVGHLPDAGESTVVFEMQTRRGAYLGRSDKADRTQHLLPRGVAFEVVSSHRATYTDRSGNTGSKVVVQLRDVPGSEKV